MKHWRIVMRTLHSFQFRGCGLVSCTRSERRTWSGICASADGSNSEICRSSSDHRHYRQRCSKQQHRFCWHSRRTGTTSIVKLDPTVSSDGCLQEGAWHHRSWRLQLRRQFASTANLAVFWQPTQAGLVCQSTPSLTISKSEQLGMYIAALFNSDLMISMDIPEYGRIALSTIFATASVVEITQSRLLPLVVIPSTSMGLRSDCVANNGVPIWKCLATHANLVSSLARLMICACYSTNPTATAAAMKTLQIWSADHTLEYPSKSLRIAINRGGNYTCRAVSDLKSYRLGVDWQTKPACVGCQKYR